MSGFTVTGGDASDPANPDAASCGGGIRDQNNVSLTLTDMLLTDNVASADGGAVSMENVPTSAPWTLTLNNTVVRDNHAGDAGGGVESDGTGQVFITGGKLTPPRPARPRPRSTRISGHCRTTAAPQSA